ncbi:MAG: PKD domain-containing protein [Flavobacteriales bacterium]
MSNKLTAFEEKVRGAMDHYELPYDSGSWNDMNNRLDSGASANTWIVAVAAAFVFTAIGSWTIYKYSFDVVGAKGANHIARFESELQVKNAGNSVVYAENSSFENFNQADESSTTNVTNLNNHSATALSQPTIEVNATTATSEAGLENETNAASTPNGSENTGTNKVASSALSVATSVTETCSGGEIEFTALNGPREGSYLWNFGDGNFSNKPNPKHKYLKPGVYDVSLSITSKRDGQINTTVMNDLITVNPTPSADFEWDFINGASEEPTVKVINTSDNADSYTWKFGDGSTSNEISPVKSYSEQGKQLIVLEVANEFGCADSKVKYIHINQEYNLMAPESFSIKNGVFMPEGLKSGKNKFKLTIYNGEQPIYESTSKSKGWDGTLPNGAKAIAGDQYPWIVILYNDVTKEEKYFSGIVTILP